MENHSCGGPDSMCDMDCMEKAYYNLEQNFTCGSCGKTGPFHKHESVETVVTNETTGGMKGSKLAQLFDAPPEALLELAKVYGYGAEKYTTYGYCNCQPMGTDKGKAHHLGCASSQVVKSGHHNYRKGYLWSLSYNALLRHVLASINGEDVDPESGRLHMAHAAWHCLALIQFYLDKQAGRTPEKLDDRYLYPDMIEVKS